MSDLNIDVQKAMSRPARDAIIALAVILGLVIIVFGFLVGFKVIGGTKENTTIIESKGAPVLSRSTNLARTTQPQPQHSQQQSRPQQQQQPSNLAGAGLRGMTSAPYVASLPQATYNPATAQNPAQMQREGMSSYSGMAALQGGAAAARYQQDRSYNKAVDAHMGNRASHGNNVSANVAAGAGDAERAVAAALAANPQMLDQAGRLPSVLQEPQGTSHAHGMSTAIKAGNFQNAFSDGNMRSIDPEGAAKLDKALSMTGTPQSFELNASDATQRKNSEILKTLMLNASADPSIEDVLAAGPAFIATKDLLRRAVGAQTDIDRSIIIQPPISRLYQSPLYRTAVPAPTLSPFTDTNIPPGLEYYQITTSCGANTGPMTQEPY